MGDLAAVGHALEGDDHVEVVLEGVHRGGPHAAAGGQSGDHHGVDLVVDQQGGQLGAEEPARLVMLADHHLARLGRQLVHDDVARGQVRVRQAATHRLPASLLARRGHVAGIVVHLRVVHGVAEPAGLSQQPSAGRHCRPAGLGAPGGPAAVHERQRHVHHDQGRRRPGADGAELVAAERVPVPGREVPGHVVGGYGVVPGVHSAVRPSSRSLRPQNAQPPEKAHEGARPEVAVPCSLAGGGDCQFLEVSSASCPPRGPCRRSAGSS